MERVVYGDIAEGLEVVLRDGRYFLRYDAGAHQVAWREDEINAQEFQLVSAGGKYEHEGVLQVQRRIASSGQNPYIQNWVPAGA